MPLPDPDPDPADASAAAGVVAASLVASMLVASPSPPPPPPPPPHALKAAAKVSAAKTRERGCAMVMECLVGGCWASAISPYQRRAVNTSTGDSRHQATVQTARCPRIRSWRPLAGTGSPGRRFRGPDGKPLSCRVVDVGVLSRDTGLEQALCATMQKFSLQAAARWGQSAREKAIVDRLLTSPTGCCRCRTARPPTRQCWRLSWRSGITSTRKPTGLPRETKAAVRARGGGRFGAANGVGIVGWVGHGAINGHRATRAAPAYFLAGGKPGMPGNRVPARCSFSNISRLCST